MKHGRKRFLAIILTILMTLQQGTLEVLAAEITPSSETAAVQQAVEPKNTGPEMTDTEGTEPQTADSKKTEQKNTESKNTNQQETSQQKSNQQETSQQQPNQQEASQQQPNQQETSQQQSNQQETSQQQSNQQETSQQQSNQQEASQQQSNQQESNSQAANQQETGKSEPEAGKPEPGQSGAGKPEAGESEETEPEEEKQPAGAQIKAAVESVEEYDLAQCITKAQLKVQIGNVFYDIVSLPKDITVPKDAPVDVKIAYNPAGIKFAAGDKLIYQIPSGITVNENQKGEVKDGPITAGTYIIQKDGKIIITLDEDYLNKHDGYVKNGTISFSGHFDSSQWGQGGKQEIVFGKDTITIPFTPDPVSEKGVLNISKEILKNGTAEIKYDETNKFYYIEYKITVSTPADNTMDMPNVTVEDIFTAGGDYIQMTDGHPDIYDIDTGAKGTFAYNTEKGVWEWTGIGDMKAGESHVLTFKVKLNNKISDSGNDVGDRTITNKAEVNSNDVMKNEASVSAKANSSLNIAKTTTGYDAATGMVSYTVKVKAEDNNTWPINNVTVDDIFGTGRTFIDKYETITLSKGNITNNADKDSDKKLVWNIGTMIPGEEVTLTYKVKVNDTIFLQGTAGITTAVIENTAYLKVNGQDKSNANASVNFKKVWIWKNGKLQDDGRVRFVIHANETTTASAAAGDNVSNATIPPIDANITFEDVLGGDWVYDGDVVIQRYTKGPNPLGDKVGDPVAIDVDGETSWTWVDTQKGAYFYEIIYYAKLNPEAAVIGKPNISNGAGIGVGVGTGGDSTRYEHKTSWSGTGKLYDSLSKRFMSRTGNIAKWQSFITCNVPAGAVYSDWRQNDTGHEWEFTDEQIENIKVTAGSKELKLNTDYSVRRDGTGFKIEFKKAIEASEASPIYIDYECTLKTSDVAEGTTVTYVNKANLAINGHIDDAQAECTYTQEQLIKKTAGSYNNKTGLMTWNIRVNITGTMSGDAVVTDILPDGLEYVEAKITARGSKAAGTTMEAAEDGQTVTMNLHNLVESHDKDAYINILLTTKVVDEEFLVSNTTKIFENTATLAYNDVTKGSTAQQNIRNIALTKNGIYSKNTAPDIVYTVEVNPNGLDMLKNSQTITVEDTMGENMMLNSDSLVVKNKATGAVIDVKNTLKVNGNVFSFDVPDNQPIIITYKTYIMGEIGSKTDVTNTVTYSGRASAGLVEWKREIVIAESNATIEGNPVFYISKKDAIDKEPLKGAVFALYTINPETGEPELNPRTEVSGEDGYVCFSDLDADKVYGFREMKAPNGYYIDETTGQMTYVAFSSSAVTEAMKDLDVKIIQSGITYERFNAKGEITVKKTFDAKGAIPDGFYWFGLFDAEEQPVIIDEAQVLGKIEVKDGEVQNSITFKDIDVGDKGTAKTYYVYETDSAGQRLPKNTDGTVLVNGGRFVISGEGEVRVSGEEPKTEITVKNTEKTLEISFQASKQLKNVADTTMMTFDFGLYDEKGNLIETKQNDAEGKISFDKITYTREDTGEHIYTIREISPEEVTAAKAEKDGIIYDFTEYRVAVLVSHTTKEGLTVSVKANETELEEVTKDSGIYALPNKKGEKAAFVNHFSGKAELTKTNGKTGSEKEVLKDAEFELYRETAGQEPELIDTCTTDENGTIRKDNLAEGSYYFTETKAPVGYGIKMGMDGKPIKYTFEIGPNGGKQVLEYRFEAADEAIEFKVNKVELDSTKEVAGAELTVYGKDAEGNYTVEIDSWISEKGETHDFGDKLEAGEEYLLRETLAPEGYAYTSDIQFKVEKDGTITTGAKTAVDEKTGEVTYLVEDDITRLTILKVDESGEGVAGARLVLKDANGEIITNTDGTPKYSWVTNGEPYELGGIAAGDYILSELQAPEGYELAEDVPFTLDDAADAVNKVTMVDKTTPEEFSYYGFLNITKDVLKNGEAYETDNVYYAGVFYDAEYSRMFEKVELSMNGKSSAVQKVRVPLGKNPDTEIDFYVTEVDENGKPLENGPDLKFTVTVEGTHAVLSGKEPEAEVIITNNYVDEPKTEITITNTENDNTENVRTGDETDFSMYLMLMGAAAGAMLLTFKKRKKR